MTGQRVSFRAGEGRKELAADAHAALAGADSQDPDRAVPLHDVVRQATQ
jgi:hypothetical protein